MKEKLLNLFEDTVIAYDNLVSAIGKAERLKKSRSGIEVFCFVKGRVKIPVDKILKYCRGKVKDVEKFKSYVKELETLDALKKSGKLTSEQLKRLKFVNDEHYRINRSLEMKKVLEDFGVPDNVEWNKKIIDAIADTANKTLANKYGGIGNREVVKVIFKTPKGIILLDTKWEKIGYAKQWMNTIIIKTLK